MKQIRGTITGPSDNRAWVVADKPSQGKGDRYLVHYANCVPSVAANCRLVEGEKVIFSPANLGSDGMGAVDVKRLPSLHLEELIALADDMLIEGDKVRGRRSSYKLLRRLTSRGAAGVVWEAEDLTRGMTVALKFFAPSSKIVNYGQIGNACERFKLEAAHGKKLRHRNIVRYFDSGQHLKLPFISMEFCHGGTLADEIKNGVMPLPATVLVVGQIAEALQYLHARRIIHRDVKPSNILRRGDGTWCLGDLGIIQIRAILNATSSSDRLTKSSIHLGSWQYMAPEQYENPANVTESVDVYALGASWFEMLEGRPPLRERLAAGNVTPPIDSVNPLGHLLMRMLSYKPEDRPSLPYVLSVLRSKPPFDIAEIEETVRMGMLSRHDPDVDRATVAVTTQILPRLGFPSKKATEYLASRGYQRLPRFINEAGEHARKLPGDVLDEMATWVADELLRP